MTNLLERVAQHRDAILLAEIGALLHDLGKLSAEFVIQQSFDCYKTDKTCHCKCKFNHEEILKYPSSKYPFDFLDSVLINLLNDQKWQARLKIDSVPQFKQAPNHLGHYVSKHTDLKTGIGLLALLARCDQTDSGIDKGALPKDDKKASSQKAVKQPYIGTYIASAFGYERVPLCIDAENGQLKLARDRVSNALLPKLQEIIEGKSISVAVREAVIQVLKENYFRALGETRRAANDVTLRDHAFSVASLYKATIAYVLHAGWPSNIRDLQWRILRVAVDGLSFIGRGHTIADILGRQRALDDGLDKVRDLLEVTYPLGNEIYRDENGSAFVIPDIAELLELKNDNEAKLRELINAAFIESGVCGEAVLVLDDDAFSNSSRYAIKLGKLLDNPLPTLTVKPEKLQEWWKDVEGKEVCKVCRLRPQTEHVKGQSKQKLCEICLGRRVKRAHDWVTYQQSTTIWIDEVADDQGQVALVVGQFGLADWLNGRVLNSVLAQAVPQDVTYTGLLVELAQELENNVKPDKNSPPRIQQLAPEAFKRQTAQEFYKRVVNDRDVHGLAAGIAEDDWHTKAERLLQFLLRKHPSFARIRRVWNTTEQFWREIRDEQLREILPQRQRYLLIPQWEQGSAPPRSSGLYDGVLDNGAPISLYWQENKFAFITTINLNLTGTGLKQGAMVRVYPADDPKTILQFKIAQVYIYDEDSYVPFIPILTEPRTFMALVPADTAIDVITSIKKKYEREMGKVRNRLPLYLGLVYFKRKMPLYAALDAARRMLKVDQSGEQSIQTWQIDRARKLCNHRVLYFDNGAVWKIDEKMGDRSRDDDWYPYWQVVTASEGQTLNKKHFRVGTEDWVHMSELQKGDEVAVYPSHFSFLYLDASTRRFAAGDAEYTLLLDDVPWLTKTWKTLTAKLTATQLHALETLLKTKWEMWQLDDQEHELYEKRQETFAQLTKTELIRAKIDDAVTVDDVVSGRFFRLVELYLHIVKDEPKGENEDE